jgi:hypothetical protein
MGHGRGKGTEKFDIRHISKAIGFRTRIIVW